MWYLILCLLSAIYILINLIIPGRIDGVVGSYIIQPLLWFLLAIVTLFIARHEGLTIWQFKKIRKWGVGRSPGEAALLVGGFQVSLLVIAGLFSGMGTSPYLFTPLFIVINILFFGSALFAIEVSRAYFVKIGQIGKKNITLTIVLVTLLFMVLRLRLFSITALDVNDPVTVIRFFGEVLIPGVAMSLFASYLAYLGGALPAICYVGTLQAFEYLSPVLPDLSWIVQALIATVAPTIGFLIIQNSIQETRVSLRRKIKKPDSTLSWAIVVLVAVFLVFFSLGYFGVHPTVVYSGSMQPALDIGDIVILSAVPVGTIKAGDIIQYRLDHIDIIHRVYNISGDKENKVFNTKGDANSDVDIDPVASRQIKGKVLFTLPKIGWIPIAIKAFVANLYGTFLNS